MTSPHYTHDYLINIGGINIGIYLGNNLYQSKIWRDFFSTRLTSSLIDKNSDPFPSFKVVFTGPRLNLFKPDARTVGKHIQYPRIRGRVLTFNNFLHPNLLVLHLFTLIERELAKRSLLTLHASGIVIGGRAILFSGVSGSGKSTALMQRLEGSQVLGDDKILLKIQGEDVLAFPSPLNDKVVVDLPSSPGIRVSGIIFIKKQGPAEITKISPKEAFPSVLNQVLTPPYNNTVRRSLLSLAKTLSHCTYQLNYRLGENIVPLIQEIP